MGRRKVASAQELSQIIRVRIFDIGFCGVHVGDSWILLRDKSRISLPSGYRKCSCNTLSDFFVRDKISIQTNPWLPVLKARQNINKFGVWIVRLLRKKAMYIGWSCAWLKRLCDVPSWGLFLNRAHDRKRHQPVLLWRQVFLKNWMQPFHSSHEDSKFNGNRSDSWSFKKVYGYSLKDFN